MSDTIKKAYGPIVELLQANPNAKVKDVLPEVLELATAKNGGGGKPSTHHMNEKGEVVAVRCYYHKLWMDPRIAEFGKKANTPTKLNTMCKDGANKYSQQQRTMKNSSQEMLDKLHKGEMKVEQIPEEQARIAEEAQKIVPREDGYGFETLEECLEHSKSEGLEV